MPKILLIPSNLEMLKLDCDGFILGITNLSINMPFYIELEQLKDIKTDKEIFISLNKNIHENELDKLEQTLKELNNYNIKGVFFYDTSIVNLKQKLNLKYDLVWSQEHLTTNSYTINFWNNQGVEYTYLSSEITIREIQEIKENTRSKLILPIFGYIPMMDSKRNIVKNYLKQFNLKDNSKINYIEKEGNVYPIIDDNITTVYTNKPLNGLKDYLDLKVEYVTINSFLIDNIEEILKIYKNVTKENIDEYNERIDSILNTDTFFLHKETIYKVK